MEQLLQEHLPEATADVLGEAAVRISARLVEYARSERDVISLAEIQKELALPEHIVRSVFRQRRVEVPGRTAVIADGIIRLGLAPVAS